MTSKPRVIRKVATLHKTGKYKGQAKVAKDRKNGYRVERVMATGNRECAAGHAGCVLRYPIIDGWDYAKVNGPEDVKRVRVADRGVLITPDPKDYHWSCLPEGAVRLRRFFFPKPK